MFARASRSAVVLLANLRWLAVAGQAATVLLATRVMGLALPEAPLWGGIAALAAFNLYASWRARAAVEVSPVEIFVHLVADITVLAWLVAWSGGIENPFASLFLLPMALAILSLPPRWAWLTACACALGYALSAIFGRELPHAHGAFDDAFTLHKAGMLVSFVVSAAVALFFFARMAAAWRQSEREIAQLRERFARNEGILALATHAASVAHELNTPLGTLTLMVEELESEATTSQQRDTCATMRSLLDVCRERVRELAAPAERDTRAARVDLERVIERWQLVRPAVDLHRSGALRGERVDPAVGYLLQALLNNAADAGEQAGIARVDLELRSDENGLRGEIRDYGAGLAQADPQLPATLFRTSKPGGLGIGLALSHATVERLGGRLSMEPTPEGRGVRVAFWLPATP